MNIQECGLSGKGIGKGWSVPNVYVNFNHTMWNFRNNDETSGTNPLNYKHF